MRRDEGWNADKYVSCINNFYIIDYMAWFNHLPMGTIFAIGAHECPYWCNRICCHKLINKRCIEKYRKTRDSTYYIKRANYYFLKK